MVFIFRRARRGLFTLALSAVLAVAIYLVTTGSPLPARPASGLRFVDGSGNALSGVNVRILCFANPGDTIPLADLQRTTDAGGAPSIPLPVGCNYLAALQLVHTQPSSKPNHGPAYWVFATSFSPTVQLLLPATGPVTITLANPLVLFNIVASVEWQPTQGSPFVPELLTGLQNASAYLYGLSQGQMAIGPVSIATGGQNWSSADLRFRAANDYHPSARVGGIVNAATPYTPTTMSSTVFVPGEITLGRYWDGADAFSESLGKWSLPNAYRTLVHEWSHYALFLYDEYQATDSTSSVESYCTCSDLPAVTSISNPSICGGATIYTATSAMAYHYTAGQLWSSGMPAVCMATDQWLVHGEPDWQTLAKWSRIQGLPVEWLNLPASVTPGPGIGIVSNLFGRVPGFQTYLPAIARSGTVTQVVPPPQLVIEPAITVAVSTVLSNVELYELAPQVYVTMPSQGRIVYEGTTNGSRVLPDQLATIKMLGVPKTDGRVRVFVDRYASAASPGSRYTYPPPGGPDPTPSNGQTLVAITDTWRSSLYLDYGLSDRVFTTLTVTLVSLDALAFPPTAQLCQPDAAAGCGVNPLWTLPMLSTGAVTWTAVFTASPGGELPHYGIVDVSTAGGRELMRWYLAGGGVGPSHIDGNAPSVDGILTVESLDLLPGAANMVAFMPAADYASLHAPLPANIRGIVGMPLDMRIILPAKPVLSTTRPGDRSAAQLPSYILTLFFSQAGLRRLDVSPTQLVLLHYDRTAGQWLTLLGANGQNSHSSVLDWVNSVPVTVDGIYAIGFE